MKKKSLYIGSFFCVYVVFLLVLLPASVVVSQLTLPKNVQFSSVDGSIWHSQIDTVVIDGHVINNVDAKLSVLSMLTFDPTISISFGGALVNGPEGRANVSGLLTQLTITDASVSILANTIAQQLTLPVDISASKYVDVDVKEFVVGKPLCDSLIGSINWREASVTVFDSNVSLGNLAATLTCEQGDVVATINEKNQLGLSFTASVGKGMRMSGDGFLTPNSNTPEQIKQALPFIGKPDNQGRYRLRF